MRRLAQASATLAGVLLGAGVAFSQDVPPPGRPWAVQVVVAEAGDAKKAQRLREAGEVLSKILVEDAKERLWFVPAPAGVPAELTVRIEATGYDSIRGVTFEGRVTVAPDQLSRSIRGRAVHAGRYGAGAAYNLLLSLKLLLHEHRDRLSRAASAPESDGRLR